MAKSDSPDEERNFTGRYSIAVGAAVLMLASAGVVSAIVAFSRQSPPSRPQQLSIVQLLPPPPSPPPPTPPPIQQATPPPMVEQQKMVEPESKPQEPLKKDEPPKPKAPPAGPLGVKAPGQGAGDQFGLVGRPGGNGLLGNGEGGGGSRWGWYAAEVQTRIEEALHNNPRTRGAQMNVQVRIWPDRSGKITRAQLTGSTGDPALDRAIAEEVLSGLQLQEPPPADLPSPIVLRLVARRP